MGKKTAPSAWGFAFFVYLISILITRAGDFRQSMQNYVSEVNDWLLLLLLEKEVWKHKIATNNIQVDVEPTTYKWGENN